MGRPSIVSIHRNALYRLSVVERFLIKAQHLPPDLYGFVAEVMMLRIFSIIEYTVRETATRLACGVPYRDGIFPSHIIHVCSSLSDAINKFKSHNRGSKPKYKLQFNNVRQTNESIKFIIDSNESFRIKLNAYGVKFEEMRKVRNHIAHTTSSTRNDFKDVIRQRYGGYVKLKPAVYLISTKRQSRSIINEYLITARIMANEITKS